MIEAGLFLVGLICGMGTVVLFYRPLVQRYAESERQLREDAESKYVRMMALSGELATRSAQVEALERQLVQQQEQMTRDDVRRKEEDRHRTEQQQAAFKNLANEILEEKSRQFKQTNQDSLELLLKPFRENIDNFRKRVDEVYDKEAQQRFSLREEIRRLSEVNLRMSEEANNLTHALKGDSKVQGDWGEMILETILDQSHLIKGVHYLTQETLKDETGNNLRPDVILNLPDNKQIVIDSKVSLTGYVSYCESNTLDLTAQALKEHLRSVRSHIDELGGKRYQTLVNSPDFVILFMPNEPAFLLAVQHDPELWSDAYHKKVIVSSPTNLFALLKLVDDLWRRDTQSKNAITIAAEGANLYDKLVGFAETFLDLGRGITLTGERYDRALKQLKTGNGNLIRRAERLRELGVKATKRLPSQMEDYEVETERP